MPANHLPPSISVDQTHDGDDFTWHDGETGFLLRLANAGFGQGLTRLQPAAGEGRRPSFSRTVAPRGLLNGG